jgi:uncharacterized protein YbjT (DUF2867 family)
MKKVLVAGASGYLGRYTALEFKNRGYHVRAFVRNPEKLKHPGHAGSPAIHDIVDEVFVGDATKPETLDGVCEGIDIVFSSMGLSQADSSLNSFDVDYEGNKRILGLAQMQHVEKFIYISIFRAELLMESSLIQAHERFADDLKKSGLDYTIIRPNAYFSDMGQFLKLARSGHMFWLGDGSNKINPIHGADMAKVCVDSAGQPNSEIDAGGPDMFTYKSLFTLAFEAVNKPPNITFLPLWTGETLLWVIRLFNHDLADKASFFVLANKMDNDAPPYGNRHIRDYFQELASKT